MDPEQEKDLVVKDLEQRLAQVHKAFEAVLADIVTTRFVNNIAYQDLLSVRTIEGENNQPVIYWTDPIKDPTSRKEEVTPDAYTDEMDDNFGISFDVS